MIRDDLGVEDCITASAMFDNIRAEKKKRKSEGGDEYVYIFAIISFPIVFT